IGFVAYDQFIMKGKFEQKIPFSLFSGTEEKNVYNYSCQGKVYCSEMTSCDEAKFYLRNCPNTQMDGDGDGIPCESQWCSW
ncbi:MAG: excalibur calcium-binding domain-containing protein, partial [Anaerolineae bacterium]|nr:excalibur calcium-binding domain-containing protein [Anaerolineae bacterium]